jgi:hypothetical protein
LQIGASLGVVLICALAAALRPTLAAGMSDIRRLLRDH